MIAWYHLILISQLSIPYTGLDAASAFRICKVIKAATITQNFSAITCLLQPSDDVYRTFHRVILLTPDGQVAYSGKTEDALAHFDGLGLKRPDEMNIPEYLLRCASSPADLWDNEENGDVPKALSSSSDFAGAFINSPAGQAAIAELENKGDGRAAESAFEQNGNAPALKDFAQPTSKQIQLLINRGWKLVKRNPANLMRLVSAIVCILPGVLSAISFSFCINTTPHPHFMMYIIDKLFASYLVFLLGHFSSRHLTMK